LSVGIEEDTADGEPLFSRALSAEAEDEEEGSDGIGANEMNGDYDRTGYSRRGQRWTKTTDDQ
jgi:hypothetical protein